MNTFGRILIILLAFAIVMGITYFAVNASSASTSGNVPASERGGESFRSLTSERPAADDQGPGGGWMFGLMKNISIVGIIVALIVVPTSFMRRKVVPVRAK